ncbi:asparagine synthase-domain-containing protein [Paraphoma chrysanthemicola]|uniref:Asparagine synthase-domain-containing protein n=1 Tax=Paraphoma chrysanthemicola TaxID=798071 RepID=A0A8K0RAT4_9PLEO|nr:asparagine synthase-domain-containing protein [Paraphoma chrysanthemicola]
MCGIFCSISRDCFLSPDAATEQLLRNRGPDSIGQHQVLLDATSTDNNEKSHQLHATFLSTVLSLRGTQVVDQPLRDADTSSILCWNGEAWTVGGEHIVGNDSQVVFQKLLAASRAADDAPSSRSSVTAFMSSIKGPYAFVFWDAYHKTLYYGRDCLGRRSLLKKSTSNGTLVLSSVCDNASGEAWAEVEADGIYLVDLSSSSASDSLSSPTLIAHDLQHRSIEARSPVTSPFPVMNRSIPESPTLANGAVDQLKTSLEQSLKMRIQHVREAIIPSSKAEGHASKVAILFSGGLDCTILARMCHDLMPFNEQIDLLNVAFENPRIHGKLDPGTSPFEVCPDRITGRSSHAELRTVCPGRSWNFVAIDVPYTETVAHRAAVMTLMHPHNTEMDLSISYALYFASRGVGRTQSEMKDNTTPYATPAHVLLSGLGADELFGGYQRHATAFDRRGYTGLLDELELDFNRLGKRNLGRDDRIISSSSKEVRFPYLDEDFIALALQLPVATKCDFGCPPDESSDNPVQFLEPAKRALRLLAWRLGMKNVAAEKKRAIQFGARTAKMETGKTKGTHVLT